MHERFRAFLQAHNTLSLATIDDRGRPHACALFYAYGPDLTLYFLSDPRTAHARHLKDGAPIAATIENNNQQWQSIQGLQLHGIAYPCSEPFEEEIARELYMERFPFVAGASRLATALARARFYKIIPTWLRLIDNSQGFGHKEEWQIAQT